MTNTYCPKRNGIACNTCGNASWGTPMRVQRFAYAVATLAAMGGVEGDRFRCPVTGAWLTIGVDPVEVDRPEAGACYTLGNMVITSRNGNQSRNAGESAQWVADYIVAVSNAAATVGRITGRDAQATWSEWHPVTHSEHVATGATWWK